MKFIKFLFSGTFMGILLVTFAVAIGYATFVENDFDFSTGDKSGDIDSSTK